MENILKQNEDWLKNSEGIWKQDLQSVQGNESEITDRFYKSLEFGTGGLRGIIGTGINRINIYTIRRVSQGLADYINNIKKDNSIAVSYDSRNFSYEFAVNAAQTFASRGIKVFLFSTLSPTPLLSYAVRYLKCDAGVMVTASHNPKEYNGYKVYGNDGCQLTLEASEAVLKNINNIDDYFSVHTDSFENYLKSGSIDFIGSDVYEKFMGEVINCSVSNQGEKAIKIVYTPLNGTGNLPVRDVLRRRGFSQVYTVSEQEMPDGNFTTCPYPNPEAAAALEYALKLADVKKAELVLATDPDCDRLGAAVRHNGKMKLLTGNEVGILLSDYLLSQKKIQGTLPLKPYIIKTIVTSDMIYDIAKDYNAEVGDVLTGFKFIGERLKLMEEEGWLDRFVLGFEESYGYMAGAYVRDKDGVVASMLVAEMAEYYMKQNKTLIDRLCELFEKYGYSESVVKSIEFKGMEGVLEMNKRLDFLRANPPKKLGDYEVIQIKDYLSGIEGLPSSNVLSLYVNSAKVLVRPSGTEPKLKIYVLAKAQTPAKLKAYTNELLTAIMKFF